MNSSSLKKLLFGGILATLASVSAQAQTGLRITEVHPTGSSNGTYAADWFELTNFGPGTIDLTGFRVDDNSQSPAAAVALSGVTSIAPGQSVVFIEGTSATASAFLSAWFGGAVPAGFTIGTYSGAGIGLSSTSDQVNIYNPAGATPNTPVASVLFNAATAGRTFDNAAGQNSDTVPITLLSTAGVNGAFLSANGQEVGSPGVVPEPSTVAALLAGAGILGIAARRRRGTQG